MGVLVNSELGESLSEFGKAVKLLGTCEDDALGKAFSELGAKSEIISIKLQKEVISSKRITNDLFSYSKVGNNN